MANPAKFMREVRQEMHKVTWPKRKEVIASTLMVIVLTALFSVFFLMVDTVLGWGVTSILGMGK